MTDQIKKVRNACDLLYDASRSIRILTHLGWPLSVREKFFADGCKELPVVEYPDFEPGDFHERLATARAAFDCGAAVNGWLEGIAGKLETSAAMLAATDTPEFHEHSVRLYGSPESQLIDDENTSLGLARQFDKLFDHFQGMDLGVEEFRKEDADSVASAMKHATTKMFGDDAPNVQIVEKLSANALAGPKRIRIRRDADFTDKDVQQLIYHEAHIHVGTSLNGIAQPNLKILAAAHAGTTKTQEGLAVFAEFITGAMGLDRFRRLADRVIAIQMAVEGADFLEVFKFFHERTDDPEQSFENTRRVFRGGVLTGGSPFTKDGVYLDGLLRVHNFFRTAVSSGRADCLRLLFCGKLDLEDFPVLAQLAAEGICAPARYLPPWAKDIRFLLCYLSYSSFLNRIDLSKVKQHYSKMFEELPKIS